MAEPVRSDEYGSRPNREQVEAAKVERQIKAGERPANINGAPTDDSTRNTNVVRFGEVGERTRNQDQNYIRNAYPDTASQFTDSYNKAGIQPTNLDSKPDRAAERQRQEQIRTAKVEYSQAQVSERPTRIPVVKKKKKSNAALREVARLRATAINAWVIATSSILFLPLLILSIFSVIFMGMAAYVDWLYANPPNSDPNTNFFQAAINGVQRFFATIFDWVVSTILALWGYDMNLLDPHNMFMLSYIGTIGIGYFILLVMFFMYAVSFIKCLSGEHAHTKQIAFLIALIGHSIPFMNLFPWFLVWAVAVWIYPK